MNKPVDRLICNAGVYQPSLDYAKWSVDNHEQTMQINFFVALFDNFQAPAEHDGLI
jgi:short-subunit dehydrogenase